MDILFRHSPTIFPRMRKHHVLYYFLLQQYYFYGLSQVIGVFLMTLYFFFGFQSTHMSLVELFYFYVPLLLFQLVPFFWFQRFNIDPPEEKGFLWRGRLLSLAAWPIYFTSLVGVIVGRKLEYAITPKGKSQVLGAHPSLFIPHFILGTVSLIGIVVAFATNNVAPQVLVWAFINLVAMYGFCVGAVLQLRFSGAFESAV